MGSIPIRSDYLETVLKLICTKDNIHEKRNFNEQKSVCANIYAGVGVVGIDVFCELCDENQLRCGVD